MNNQHGYLPTGFEGSIDITVSRHICKSWSNTPYASTIGHNHNHCRSPDNDLMGAWCYTTNTKITWDYCAFPITVSGNYLQQSFTCIRQFDLYSFEFNRVNINLGMSGKLALLDDANSTEKLWKVESNCTKTHIFSTVFDTQANVDFVIIEGALYSGQLSFDLEVSNSFFVGFSSRSGELTKPGFELLWECQNDVLDTKCCSDIEASGFSKNEINGIYTFTGNFINGRHLYVGQNPVFGIWYNGLYGDAADWVLGWMSELAEGRVTYGWALSNQDTSCPSLTKEWDQWWYNQWVNSETDNVKCLV